ncbi:Hypothetical protein D9617_23g005920 [Elsinoe fawcettii]|nr:Hypothetical protein D9617_23g005920 [Elsinoe fawcettii]
MLLTTAFAIALGLAEGASLEPRKTTGAVQKSQCGEAADKINAAFKDPLVACFWFMNRRENISPLQSVDATAFLSGCPCLFATPAAAKSTLPTPKKGKNAARNALAQLVSSPTDFCNYWLANANRKVSPFVTMGVKKIDSFCADVSTGVEYTPNYLVNPLFEGSGDLVPGYLDDLSLQGWTPGGYWISVRSPKEGENVGNQVTLWTSFSSGNSSLDTTSSQISQTVNPQRPITPVVFVLQFSNKVETENSECFQEVLVDNRSIWNSTVVNRSQKLVRPEMKRVSVTFNDPTPFNATSRSRTELTFRGSVLNGTSGGCSWKLASVLLTLKRA